MKHFFLLLIYFLLFGPLNASKKVISIKEVNDPAFIDVYGGKLFLTDGPQIFIFSLKDGKLLNKFGREGDGPQELRTIQKRLRGLDVSANKIVVNGIGKLINYSLDGQYIDEIKTTGDQFTGLLPFRPFGVDYVGYDSQIDKKDQKMYITVSIFDYQMKKQHELCRTELLNVSSNKINPIAMSAQIAFAVSGNNVCTSVANKLEISVFDKNAKLLRRFNHEYNQKKLTDDDKARILENFKQNPKSKQYFEIIKNMIEFPEYWPVSRKMVAKDGLAYVLTWKQNNKSGDLIYIFDLKYGFKRQVNLNLVWRTYLEPFPFTISQNKLYQLVENNETQEYDLFVYDM